MNSKFTNDLANKLKNGVQQPTVPKQQAPVVEAKYEPPKIKDPFLEGFYEEELKAGLISEDKLYVKPNEAPMLEEHYKVPMPQIKPLQYPEIDYNALLQSVRAELKLTPPVQATNNTPVWNQEAFLEGFNSIAPNNVPTPKNTLTSKTSDSIFRREEPTFAWQEQVSNELSETVRDEAFLEGFLGDEYESNAWANNANSFGAGNREEIENLSRRFGFGAYLATVDRSAYGQPVYTEDYTALLNEPDLISRIIFHEESDIDAYTAIAWTFRNRRANFYRTNLFDERANIYNIENFVAENTYTNYFFDGYSPFITSESIKFWNPQAYILEASNRWWNGVNNGQPIQPGLNHCVNLALALDRDDNTFEVVYPPPFTGNSALPIQDYTQVYQFRSAYAWDLGYDNNTHIYTERDRDGNIVMQYEIIGYEIIGNTIFFQHA